MATMNIFTRPSDLALPARYSHRNLENNVVAYMKKLESEVPNCSKYVVGRLFYKSKTYFEPVDRTLVEHTHRYPVNITCQVYVPDSGSLIFFVGSDFSKIYQDFVYFTSSSECEPYEIDLAAVEGTAFSTGLFDLFGHSYDERNVNFTVTKTDGAPFTRRDTDFKPCDEVDKLFLKLSFSVEDKKYTFYVYSEGVITKKGPLISGVSDYQVLKRIFDAITSS